MQPGKLTAQNVWRSSSPAPLDLTFVVCDTKFCMHYHTCSTHDILHHFCSSCSDLTHRLNSSAQSRVYVLHNCGKRPAECRQGRSVTCKAVDMPPGCIFESALSYWSKTSNHLKINQNCIIYQMNNGTMSRDVNK